MKYKIFFLIFFLSACVPSNYSNNNKETFNSKGLAYIFTKQDYENKIISSKLNNELLQISHNKLKFNSFIKLTNPITNDTIVLRNSKKIKYPELYSILITEPVADKLNLNYDLPLVEIIEIKKNKSFVAKEAKIFNEEKKISSNAPVTSVQISNISKNKKIKKKSNNDEIFIIIASFYSKESAYFLRDRIINELPIFDSNKLIVKKNKYKEINLISGPYKAVNLMKNDYILLKNFGFEELNISINE